MQRNLARSIPRLPIESVYIFPLFPCYGPTLPDNAATSEMLRWFPLADGRRAEKNKSAASRSRLLSSRLFNALGAVLVAYLSQKIFH